MKSFIRLTQFDRNDLMSVFQIADRISEYQGFLNGKTVVMFFPNTSIRTRVSFEKGIYLLGGQSIMFPPETLDKREDIRDVCGYLQNWADAVIVRHKDISILDKMSSAMDIPVIIAMTDENHPCEIIADLYALSKRRPDFLNDQYLFTGLSGNIGRTWKEAAEAFGLSVTQCCPRERVYRIDGMDFEEDLQKAIIGKDVICTDSFPIKCAPDIRDHQVTAELLEMANEGAILNPCPPFYRGEEVSEDAIASPYFVGYEFKKSLLTVQQAILIYCLQHQ
ncbi:MAG: peptide transporter [Erysipelotrichaceae bacterium]|nr:peptide transporter [Erysipelotrichaceae bacterium]